MVGLENRNKAQGAGRRAVADLAVITLCGKQHPSQLPAPLVEVNYIEEYGERCWETDILPASVIEQALDDHIRSWRDAKLWARRGVEIERARALL